MKASRKAIDAGARALFAVENCDRRQMLDVESNWHGRLNDENREEYRILATAVLTAAAPIIAAQAKADALREAAENLWSESLTDAVPRTEADRTARIIAVKLRRTAATIEGATP